MEESHPALARRPIGKGEEVDIFRFVHTSDPSDEQTMRNDFVSDLEAGSRPTAREKEIPELREAVSVFRELHNAQDVWGQIAKHVISTGGSVEDVRVGQHIARVRLTDGHGFDWEDLDDPQGHLYVWGDPDKLEDAVQEIVPAADTEGEAS